MLHAVYELMLLNRYCWKLLRFVFYRLLNKTFYHCSQVFSLLMLNSLDF